MDFEYIKFEIEDGVARLQLAREGGINYFTTDFYREISDAVQIADRSREVDVLVISGQPKSFGTGGDLRELLGYLEPDADPRDIYKFNDNLPYNPLRECSKVSIAAVRGYCLAGGLAIASEADISIAAEDAVFGIPEARIGLGESWVPSVLYPRISMAKLKYMLFTGKTIDATEAERIGLITEVVAAENLDRRVEEVVGEVRRTSPVARRLYRRIVSRMIPRGDSAEMWEALRSAAGREGLSAFSEGREPRYREIAEDDD